jgi:hypothetical protein
MIHQHATALESRFANDCVAHVELDVDAGQRADILQQLVECGIGFPQVAAQAGQPDADSFDLLYRLAFNATALTCRDVIATMHVGKGSHILLNWNC